MAAQPQDDGFHEIQLNGKQLVFLFMAATVVSVVIFLCGVLVGRGVRAERSGSVETTLAEPVAAEVPTAAAPGIASSAEPPTEAPRPVAEDLTYFNRLDQSNPPAEALKPPAAARTKTETPASPVSRPATQEPVTPAAPPALPAASASDAPHPFAVQIAALNVRSEADAMAKRLSSKGYAAFVLAPASGTPAVYRVRIGPFNTRREADSVASRLQKEEQFKPWVTR